MIIDFDFMICSGNLTNVCGSVSTVNDDLVKDCLSVLYNCCICVSILLHFVHTREMSEVHYTLLLFSACV